MSYVDQEYYLNEYLGTPVENEPEFNRVAKRASDDIDNLTNYRIRDFDNLHPFLQKQIKKAVCAQIEHYQLNGGYDAVKQSESIGNVSIGSFSYGGSASKGGSSSNKNDVSSAALSYLKPTGLLYRGLGAAYGN